jgi:hypothetical protein
MGMRHSHSALRRVRPTLSYPFFSFPSTSTVLGRSHSHSEPPMVAINSAKTCRKISHRTCSLSHHLPTMLPLAMFPSCYMPQFRSDLLPYALSPTRLPNCLHPLPPSLAVPRLISHLPCLPLTHLQLVLLPFTPSSPFAAPPYLTVRLSCSLSHPFPSCLLPLPHLQPVLLPSHHLPDVQLPLAPFPTCLSPQ